MSTPLGTPAAASRVLILGGGFGGIAAANALRRLLTAEHAITLVDQSPRFHIGACNSWIMLGERTYQEVSRERAALLEPGVEFLQSEIRELDLPGRRVLTAKGAHAWDFLVIALGAAMRQDTIPGLASAHTFYTPEGAERLRAPLAEFTAGEVVLLVPKAPFKCPPAPYETAFLLQHFFAQRGRRASVRLSLYTVEGAPMATAGPEMGAFIREEMTRRGIGYFPQKTVARVDEAARRIEFADGTAAAYDLLLCVPPHEAPAVVRAAQLLNPAGWIPVDPQSLEVKSFAGNGRVFAIGDITSIALPGRFKPDVGLSLPKAGVMAAAQGEVVALRIAAQAMGRTPTAMFDGAGYCYLETGGATALKANGSFFALPHPAMNKAPASAEAYADKLVWVERLLAPRRP